MISNSNKYNINVDLPWKELGLLALGVSLIAIIAMVLPAVLGATPVLH